MSNNITSSHHCGNDETAALATLWRDVSAVARDGLARGLTPDAILPGVLTYSHNMRRGLHLLDAHKLALEAIREARAGRLQ